MSGQQQHQLNPNDPSNLLSPNSPTRYSKNPFAYSQADAARLSSASVGSHSSFINSYLEPDDEEGSVPARPLGVSSSRRGSGIAFESGGGDGGEGLHRRNSGSRERNGSLDQPLDRGVVQSGHRHHQSSTSSTGGDLGAFRIGGPSSSMSVNSGWTISPGGAGAAGSGIAGLQPDSIPTPRSSTEDARRRQGFLPAMSSTSVPHNNPLIPPPPPSPSSNVFVSSPVSRRSRDDFEDVSIDPERYRLKRTDTDETPPGGYAESLDESEGARLTDNVAYGHGAPVRRGDDPPRAPTSRTSKFTFPPTAGDISLGTLGSRSDSLPRNSTSSSGHPNHNLQPPQSRRSRSLSPRRGHFPLPLPEAAGGVLQSAARNLRRVSLRVVNLAGIERSASGGVGGVNELGGIGISQGEGGGLGRRATDGNVRMTAGKYHVRLEDDIEEGPGKEKRERRRQEGEDMDRDEEEMLNLKDQMAGARMGGLRGRSLGIFGPENRFRRSCEKALLWSWTEPIILLLIILYVVVLTVQAANSAFVEPARTAGYFVGWEEYVLFVIMLIFTLEIVVRIVVSGLVFNPRQPFIPGTNQPMTVSQSRFQNFADKLKSQLSYPPQADYMPEGPDSSYRWANDLSYTDEKEPVSTAASSQVSLVKEQENAPFSSLGTRKRSGLKGDEPAVYSTPGSTVKTLPPYSYATPNAPNIYSTTTTMPTALKTQASSTSLFGGQTPFAVAIERQKTSTRGQTAYLRHSWNRVDMLAVASFWISFILAVVNVEDPDGGFNGTRAHILIFRMMSVLRGARLLTITTGTTTILRSLKKAAPLLVNVAFFVLFAMVLFSIIGIQSFKGSFKRACVWIDPAGQQNMTTSQKCGGQIDAGGTSSGYIMSATQSPAPEGAKGFLCPVGQLCIEGQNPFNGTNSFDNVFASALQVVVVASANTWTGIMYGMMDADFFVSCVFFIVCLIILNFWLINMFVAVITNTFSEIMVETKHSAFASSSVGPTFDQTAEGWTKNDPRRKKATNFLKKIYDKTRLFWVLLVLVDMGFQTAKSVDSPPATLTLLNNVELYFTIAFDVEILIRFVGFLPDWRTFTKGGVNIADTFLALMTTIIQIPVIHNSSAYPWTTFFQIARFYRVIISIPRIKRLLARVLNSISGLINMILFLLMMNFIVALMAAQFLRGDIPMTSSTNNAIEMSFYQIFNAFLAVYQVLSSENWTDVLNNAMTFEVVHSQAWISAIFIAGWFLFGNFILLQMFIAVINESFAIAEEQKHKAQVQAFVKRSEPEAVRIGWFTKWNPYRHMKPKPRAVAVDNIPQNLVLPMQKAAVKAFMTKQEAITEKRASSGLKAPQPFLAKALRVLRFDAGHEELPLEALQARHRGSVAAGDAQRLAIDRQLELLSSTSPAVAEETVDALNERRALQADFIAAHPSYDRSLWIFPQKNSLRRFCQRLVSPSTGERIFGIPAEPFLEDVFQLVVLVAIIASVVIAGIATPVYRRQYFIDNGDIRVTWFNLTEVSLGSVFILEFLVKVVADGFVFAPNAYLLSVWNGLDFFILCTLVVNTVTSLVSPFGVSRFTRALKAFRALRLINLSHRMRETFFSVFIVGFSRIMDASILAILYIIPYAIWGLNIFSGLLYSCTDGNAQGKTSCVGEYSASPSQWNFLAPRVWQNPQVWAFDSFRQSLLILFEIISLEGWIDVMRSVMWITGPDQQPQQDAAQFNALFFVFYNLVGAVFILTLFVSVIIENFTKQSGMALLTSEQRQWIDIKKLILRQRPSKRPKVRPQTPFKQWCFDRAVQKHGYWSRFLTAVYVVHILALMTQTDTSTSALDFIRDYFFLGLTIIYTFDLFIRVIGLGWTSFASNGWNLYDATVVTGTFATTIPILLDTTNQVAIQLQKLFLVSIAFKLVQKNNSLNQLFKTAVASLPAILNLFMLWFTFFLLFGIVFVEVFSLTRWENHETRNQNYSTFPKTLVMLVLASTGEGWNGFMHDYTVESPDCTDSDNYLFSDCGSAAWAFALFIAWNVLSMYIFVNMFTGVVVENFSFVFQLYGRVQSINREQMRAFKKAWAAFDKDRTGYLRRERFIPFFARLSGAFDVAIYPAQARIDPLLKASLQPGSARDTKKKLYGEIDLSRLAANISRIDFPTVRRRRHLFNQLYQEALISEEPGRGLSFTNMLLLLAHYKLIDDDSALQLDELLQRKMKVERVQDLCSLEKVQGLLRTVYYRRQFLKRRALANAPDVPIIMVGASETDDGDNPHFSTPALPRLRVDLSILPPSSFNVSVSPASPSNSAASPGFFAPTPSPGAIYHEGSPGDPSYFDLTPPGSRRVSQAFASDEQRDVVIASMENSVWAEMMRKAADD